MFEKRVIPGKTYCIFAPGPINVTAIMNNVEVKIVDATEVGKYFFTASTTKIYSSINPNCIFEPDNSLNYNIENTPNWLYSLKAALKILLGKSTAKITLDNNKFTIAVSLDTTEAQIAEVESLLERVLPSNLVTEIEWIDGLPMSYTRLEYLESTGTQYIETGLSVTPNTGFFGDAIIGRNISQFETLAGYDSYFSSLAYVPSTGRICFAYSMTPNLGTSYPLLNGTLISSSESANVDPSLFIKSIGRFKVGLNFKGSRIWEYNDDNLNYSVTLPDVYPEEANYTMTLFGRKHGNNITNKFMWGGKIYSAIFTEQAKQMLNFIPALDPTGAPCMFDTVTRTPFRASGNGDFIIGIETQQQLDNFISSLPNYNGQAIEQLQINLAEALQTPENEARLTEAMAKNAASPAIIPLDMEYTAPKFYAKLTEHGIHRLYHVPRGYTGTMDDYAIANRFKELVEPPIPLEGYWIPKWYETETQLILDWVEAEAPTEENI